MLVFGLTFIFCCAVASFFAIKKNEKIALFVQMSGVLLFAISIVVLWITLQRPPFKTMGETRIWYSFFLSVLGGITYWQWRMSGLLTFTNFLASLFVVINILKPEVHSKVLMPALQSVWFIPHVAIYMFAYAVIGCAFVLGVLELFSSKKNMQKISSNTCNTPCEKSLQSLRLDTLVTLGTVALGIGMCLGSIWAKKAWGQYWSWDIKETAALITWAIFVLYLHLQNLKKINRKILLLIVIIGFLSMNFTWYGVKFLPVAKKSPHTFYSSKPEK